jgi:hypothetical protein
MGSYKFGNALLAFTKQYKLVLLSGAGLVSVNGMVYNKTKLRRMFG